MTNPNEIPLGHTYDTRGNVLSYKDSYGYWWKRTYDKYGNKLSYRNSDGYWWRYTRDVLGNVLSYRTSWRDREEFTYDSSRKALDKEEGHHG